MEIIKYILINKESIWKTVASKKVMERGENFFFLKKMGRNPSIFIYFHKSIQYLTKTLLKLNECKDFRKHLLHYTTSMNQSLMINESKALIFFFPLKETSSSNKACRNFFFL